MTEKVPTYENLREDVLRLMDRYKSVREGGGLLNELEGLMIRYPESAPERFQLTTDEVGLVIRGWMHALGLNDETPEETRARLVATMNIVCRFYKESKP